MMDVGIDVEREDVEDFYSGIKNFWRTGTVVDLRLIEHPNHEVIELILEITAKKLEIQRFYFRSPILYSKFSKETIEQQVEEERKKFWENPSNKPKGLIPDDQIDKELKQQVLHRLVADYVVSRLTVHEAGIFELTFQLMENDMVNGEGVLDVLCPKPQDLIRFEITGTLNKKNR
jgi:hypothetical protein